MGFRIKHIFQQNALQPKLSYTAMVLILTSVLSILSIIVTLTLSLLGREFKSATCITIFTSVFKNDVGYFTEDERNVSPEYNNVNFIRFGYICSSWILYHQCGNSSKSHSMGYCFRVAFDFGPGCVFMFYCVAELSTITIVFIGLIIAGYTQVALAVYVAGVLPLLIPLAIGFGQLTFSTSSSYTYNPDYCLASLTLFTTLLGFFITISVEAHFIKQLMKKQYYR
ncbi:hypothetical protein MS3_00004975 [Schistosoma haematobium]|uniref:Uncharacterized protein n=1 Tax=Schistosoma haematobium TaxID=6185 RepID=A0A922ITR4_SCHHA|nr:hypothetical protein MS3_00004975 [Schistosoma haematobium]KAH9587120.1 hypothetical protein MS3_00004975 [Schistosoma haematobium]